MTKRRTKEQPGIITELYDSPRFVVIHMGCPTVRPGTGWMDVFEIVRKDEITSTLLYGDRAEAFHFHIKQWQVETPTAPQVERVLRAYTELNRQPLNQH